MKNAQEKMREHIPVSYDNLFQSIFKALRHAVKVIFSLGPMTP